MKYVPSVLLTGIAISVLLVCAYGQQNKNAPSGGKKEHTFRGKIQKIDVNARTFTVNGQKVEGWMDAMTMVYVPDKEDVLKRVKVGDEITAKVYDGDFRTLHDVQVLPSKPEQKGAAGKK